MFRWRQWTEAGAKTCTTFFLFSGTFSDVRLTEGPAARNTPVLFRLVFTSLEPIWTLHWSVFHALNSASDHICVRGGSEYSRFNKSEHRPSPVRGRRGNKRPIEGHSRSCRPAQVKVMGGTDRRI